MPKPQARLVAYGGWGEVVPPAFAYDLTTGKLANAIRSSGLVRYGKQPDGDEDTRPIGLPFTLNPVSVTWTTDSGGVNFRAASGTLPIVWVQPSSTPNTTKTYHSNTFIGKNEGFFLRCFPYEFSDFQTFKLHQWFWGTPGAGYVFQIRDSKPEIARLSGQYNETDMTTLRVLWALSEPTNTEIRQREALEQKIFENYESLSFDRGMGRDSWVNDGWILAFVPEPRGVLHIVLQGGDSTAHEAKTILDTRLPGVMWYASNLRIWTGGGAFYIQNGTLKFPLSAKATFGPFDTGYFLDYLGDATYATNSYTEDGKSSVDFQMVEYGEINFGFELQLNSLTGTQTPWEYGFSARIAPGPRNGSMAQSFDTDDLYTPLGEDDPLEPDPIMDVEFNFDGPFNRRVARITCRNIAGRTLYAQTIPHDRVATLTIDGNPLITEGIIGDLELPDMATLKPIQIPNVTAKAESQLIIPLMDSWQILEETRCDPPPLMDNMPLGTAAKALLDMAGMTIPQMVGIPDSGKRLSRAALGEDWAERPDKDCTIADALRTLFESYGLGIRFYVDKLGNWHMVDVATTPVGTFSSSASNNNPGTPSGRLTILSPLDVMWNTSNFWNDFRVEGANDKSSGRWTIWESIRIPTSPIYIGRKKSYQTLRNSAIRTQADAQYALRSLVWMYGRGGRRAQFDTYFHADISPGMRFYTDGGGIWEVEGQRGASLAEDTTSYSIIEVLS